MPLTVGDIDMFILLSYREQSVGVCSVYEHLYPYIFIFIICNHIDGKMEIDIFDFPV